MKMQCSCPLLSIDHKRTKVHERIIYQYDKRKTKTGLLIHDETREIIVQETVQFLRGDPHLEMPILHKRNISGFFTDHDDVSIGHGTHSNRRTMSQPGIIVLSETGKIHRAARILLSAIITAPSCKGEFLKKIFSSNSSDTIERINTPVCA